MANTFVRKIDRDYSIFKDIGTIIGGSAASEKNYNNPGLLKTPKDAP